MSRFDEILTASAAAVFTMCGDPVQYVSAPGAAAVTTVAARGRRTDRNDVGEYGSERYRYATFLLKGQDVPAMPVAGIAAIVSGGVTWQIAEVTPHGENWKAVCSASVVDTRAGQDVLRRRA